MNMIRRCTLAGLLIAFVSASFAGRTAAGEKSGPKLKVMLVDGQNNHQWQKTTPVLKRFLERTGRFAVTVVTSPPKRSPRSAWADFRPRFADYDAVLSNYNGELWPRPVQRSLEAYVSGGGGLVIVHAANNAFPQWSEWNRMIGLGWRNNKFGDRLTVDASGRVVRTPKGKGPKSGHGPQHAFQIIVRDTAHPVMKGMPSRWMHVKDELYHGQRGPALHMHILATAYSDKKYRGTGTNEPMVWWIPYGKGKVFTTVMGHADYTMRGIGFQTVVARGCEWAATGKATLPVPRNFPTAEKTRSADK